MAKNQTQSVLEELWSETGNTVWLFEFPDPANNTTHYFASYLEDIEFPAGSGTVYKSFHIGLDQIPQEQSGKIGKVTVTVGSVNREIVRRIMDNDGLQDEEVRILRVSPNQLDSEDDKISDDTFIVDSSEFNENVATFTLATVLDRLHIRLTNPITRDDFPQIPDERTFVS